jgi:hypothetical protein
MMKLFLKVKQALAIIHLSSRSINQRSNHVGQAQSLASLVASPGHCDPDLRSDYEFHT